MWNVFVHVIDEPDQALGSGQVLLSMLKRHAFAVPDFVHAVRPLCALTSQYILCTENMDTPVEVYQVEPFLLGCRAHTAIISMGERIRQPRFVQAESLSSKSIPPHLLSSESLPQVCSNKNSKRSNWAPCLPSGSYKRTSGQTESLDGLIETVLALLVFWNIKLQLTIGCH